LLTGYFFEAGYTAFCAMQLVLFAWRWAYTAQSCPSLGKFIVTSLFQRKMNNALTSLIISLQYKVGGFIHMRHNELVNITANLSAIVCKDVEKEPILQKRFDHDLELRADVTLREFWQRQQKAFLDVRVFSPSARSYQNQNLACNEANGEREEKKVCKSHTRSRKRYFYTTRFFCQRWNEHRN